MTDEAKDGLTPGLRRMGEALAKAEAPSDEVMAEILSALRAYGEECFLEGYARALSSTVKAAETRDKTELVYWMKDAGMAVIAKQIAAEFSEDGRW